MYCLKIKKKEQKRVVQPKRWNKSRKRHQNEPKKKTIFEFIDRKHDKND